MKTIVSIVYVLKRGIRKNRTTGRPQNKIWHHLLMWNFFTCCNWSHTDRNTLSTNKKESHSQCLAYLLCKVFLHCCVSFPLAFHQCVSAATTLLLLRHLLIKLSHLCYRTIWPRQLGRARGFMLLWPSIALRRGLWFKWMAVVNSYHCPFTCLFTVLQGSLFATHSAGSSNM